MPFVVNPYPNAHIVGERFVDAGETLEVSDEEAQSLIDQGWSSVPKPKKARKGKESDAPAESEQNGDAKDEPDGEAPADEPEKENGQ